MLLLSYYCYYYHPCIIHGIFVGLPDSVLGQFSTASRIQFASQDTPQAMAQWVAAGKRLAIFSSGSREAFVGTVLGGQLSSLTFQNGNVILDDFFWFGWSPDRFWCLVIFDSFWFWISFSRCTEALWALAVRASWFWIITYAINGECLSEPSICWYHEMMPWDIEDPWQ